MKLFLLISLAAVASARPDISLIGNAGYNYPRPSNPPPTSYGVPSGSIQGGSSHYHQHQHTSSQGNVPQTGGFSREYYQTNNLHTNLKNPVTPGQEQFAPSRASFDNAVPISTQLLTPVKSSGDFHSVTQTVSGQHQHFPTAPSGFDAETHIRQGFNFNSNQGSLSAGQNTIGSDGKFIVQQGTGSQGVSSIGINQGLPNLAGSSSSSGNFNYQQDSGSLNFGSNQGSANVGSSQNVLGNRLGVSDYSRQQTGVTKHLYFYSAPEEQGEVSPRINYVQQPITKSVKVLVIKAPSSISAAPIQIPVQPQVQERTVVYVLVKKPDQSQVIDVPVPQSFTPTKPEVIFIKYKTREEAEQAIANVQSGGQVSAGVSANDLADGQEFVSTLNDDASNQQSIKTNFDTRYNIQSGLNNNQAGISGGSNIASSGGLASVHGGYEQQITQDNSEGGSGQLNAGSYDGSSHSSGGVRVTDYSSQTQTEVRGGSNEQNPHQLYGVPV